jgi:hypothetical protein
MATWQHLRSSTANKRPTTSLADGRIAINTNTASPGLFFKDSAGTGIVKVGPVHVGTTAPNSVPASGGSTGNYLGEQWLDTSVSPAQMKVWNGSTWVGIVADELPVSKLQDGAARQLIQTDAAGTGVEWTSNVDVPGTLDVTSTATFDSIAQHPLGIAAAPTITFTGDTNTGVYSPGADQVAISTGGTGRLFVGSNGNTEIISIGSVPLQVSASLPRIRSNDSDGTNLTADFYINNGTTFIDSRNDTANGAIVFRGLGGGVASEYMRIDSSARLLVGTSTAATTGTAVFQGNSGGTTSHGIINIARGTTNPGVNLSLGFTQFQDAAGSVGAQIYAQTDAAWSSGSYAGRLVFATTADGASSPTERMRIKANGATCIGTSTEGTMSGDTVVAIGPNIGIISKSASGVATSGTVDININTGGGGYQGFLVVSNTDASNGSVRTHTTFSVFGRGTDSSIQQIATDNGTTSGASFTVTTPTNGVIRVTNTSAGSRTVHIQFFGGTSF